MTNKAHKLPDNVGVAIVAPGGYAPDEVGLARGIALLENQGCVVHNYYDPAAKYQRFGGTDAARVGQLHDAADDPNVQVILALRGGYGMSRILPMLDLDKLANSGKLFVGHSDFTALQMALLAKADAYSFAGPMLCDDFTRADVSDFTMDHFWRCLTSASHVISANVTGNPAIKVTGKLWGGNLAMLTHLAGTPYFPKIDGGILFVEDINEHPYRVERMLLQLMHAGVLAKQKAILLGDFSNYRLTDYDNGYDFATMLAYLRSQLSVPVITGLPFGHIQDKATLSVGCQATLTTDADHMQLVMSGYPHLS
jgi:muramoyltetrapeptide carboxypeptidase